MLVILKLKTQQALKVQQELAALEKSWREEAERIAQLRVDCPTLGISFGSDCYLPEDILDADLETLPDAIVLSTYQFAGPWQKMLTWYNDNCLMGFLTQESDEVIVFHHGRRCSLYNVENSIMQVLNLHPLEEIQVLDYQSSEPDWNWWDWSGLDGRVFI